MNPSRFLRVSFLALGLATGLTQTALAQSAPQQSTMDWKQGEWGHLSPVIGTYDYDLILKDPAVNAKLDELMGEKKQKLLDNLFVREPIGFDRDCLVMTGNGDKEGSFEQAYLNVCLYAKTINAAVSTGDEITIYSETDTYAYLPASLRQWVYGVKNEDAFTKAPDKVKIISK